MSINKQDIFLFEVSWEVCNKVGGIYTVLRSKISEAINNFGTNYLLIGPLLESNKHFVESSNPFLDKVAALLKEKNIICKVGHWDTKGSPQVILIAPQQNRYHVDNLFYRFWASYGVDSLASDYEYVEPVLFSALCGEVIQLISENILESKIKAIAHFHEWMCGAGILYLKLNTTSIPTVFTTHATVLGRSMVGNYKDIYNLSSSFEPDIEAKNYGVYAKHSMERACAREASCFTTVSSITAEEAYIMLAKYPDKVVLNGLNIERIQNNELTKRIDIKQCREKLLTIARQITNENLPDDTLLWMTAGRYEFHNKGFDVLLESLAQLDSKLTENSPKIVVFLLAAANHRSKQDSLIAEESSAARAGQSNAIGIATHKVYDPYNDPILKLSRELGFARDKKKIHIVYSDCYLDGGDGVFDMPYEHILASCDLSIFASIYEPWGYTPLESIAYGTPTVTTNLAGFGAWVEGLKTDHNNAVFVLDARGKNQEAMTADLRDRLGLEAHQDPQLKQSFREKAKEVAKLADWKHFYQDYVDAYSQAVEFNDVYYAKFGIEDEDYVTSIHDVSSLTPKFREFQFECQIPSQLYGLRELAYNVWWSWHKASVMHVFKDIDPVLWEKAEHNPVKMLNMVSNSALMKKAADQDYMRKYQHVINLFKDYCQQNKLQQNFCDYSVINSEHPIAYFCLEYGLDKTIPIYSGGLGILAGDYLKEMSDLNIPFLAVGLFYKHGYFSQGISFEGDQIANYITESPNQLPMHQVCDAAGKPVLINLEILERKIYVAVWEVKVGRISLYLLDTDVPENNNEDRGITAKLYGGSREYRLLQEMVLGLAGARFISENLKITPSIYHLNEGHSGLLLLIRIKILLNQGLTIKEAFELVRASSVFTTHTAVPAGNEVFDENLIRKYMEKPSRLLGQSLKNLLNLAADPGDNTNSFSMTPLALNFTCGANAVSHLHKKVACEMWKGLWPGFLESEIPIMGVTNGVHVATWIGPVVKLLYDNSLSENWLETQNDKAMWDSVESLPDSSVWEAHQAQKTQFLELVQKRVTHEYVHRNEDDSLIHSTLRALNKDTLVIGFARRFATYKRHDLILRNRERIARLLTNEKQPAVLIFAGKAHPADGLGQQLVAQTIQLLRDPIYQGRVIFLQNYDMDLAKAMVQGADVWLNTPIIEYEACGTSGMKAAINGVLNCSIKDGWWAEAYADKPQSGWAIESFSSPEPKRRDEMENGFLLNTLEEEIIPMYYGRDNLGLSKKWIAKMKAAMSYVGYQFGTYRMVKDYFEQLYVPNAKRSAMLAENNFANLKLLTAWKNDVAARFNTVKIKTVLINGIKDNRIRSDGKIQVKVLLFSGKLSAQELEVQLVLMKGDRATDKHNQPIIIPLRLSDNRESGILNYSAEYSLEDTGFYSYGIRVYPYHPFLPYPQEAETVLWG